MPISISSPSRNLFLLGSVGGEVITNFFRTVNKYSTTANPNPQDYTYSPTEIRYNFTDQKFLLAGSKISGITDKYEGWIEKRTGANATSNLDNQLDVEIGISGGEEDIELMCMELDNSNNILAAGRVGDVPFVSRYTNSGNLQWQSTTNSGNVTYTGLAVDSNNNIYAAGSLLDYNGNTHAFIEKFDSNGNPGWGKSAYFLGNILGVHKIAANSRGEVVAVGTLDDDNHARGYIVKINTNTGDVMWDKTLESSEKMPFTFGNRAISCEDVFIDSNDQIYIVGRGKGFSSNVGFIVKMTAEGNIIWQKQTPTNKDIAFWNVKSDGETEQTIVLGDYHDSNGDQYGLLSKYAKNGDLVWRRVIYSSYIAPNNSTTSYGNRIPAKYGGGVNLDADPSFYYLLSTDEPWYSNQKPKTFHFGKVSTSGNGLGNFEYDNGNNETFYYEIEPIEDEIGRLDDNSVRNDTSDFITYPFNATKILFDDLATRVDNKKRHSDSLGFEYSGSPAIRPVDFQELNLLGDVYSGSGDWLDQSGKGNDGVINGATHNAAGYWVFDGSNDTIDFGDLGVDMSQMTVEIWFKSDTLTNWQNPIDCNFNVPDPNDGVVKSGNIGPRLEINASGDCRWYWGAPLDDNNRNFPSANTTITTGQWNNAVLSIDGPLGSDGSAYINGEFLGTGSQNGAGGNTWYGEIRNLKLGRGFALANRHFDGQIGEVRIYPRALTAAQVFQNYNATKTKYTNEPPDTAPKIGPGILYDDNLLLNYDFGNRATYDNAENLVAYSESVLDTWDGVFTTGLLDLINLTGTNKTATTPVGTNNAGTLTVDTTGGRATVVLPSTIGETKGQVFTYSAYLKAKDSTTCRVDIVSATNGSTDYGYRAHATFDLAAGTVGSVTENSDGANTDTPSGSTASIQNIGGGWYRCSVTLTSYDGSNSLNATLGELRPNSGGSTGSVYAWGLQMERATSPGRYIRTYGSAITPPNKVISLSNSSITGTIYGAIFDSDGYFEFDGTDDYITTPFNRGDLGNKLTIEVWYKYTGSDTRTYSAIIGGKEPVSGGTEFFIGKNTGNTSIGVQDGNYISNFVTGSNAFNGDWHHIVYTYGNGTGKIYLDDTLKNTGSFTKCNSSEEIIIGGEFEGSGYYFDGPMGEVRIYDRTLSATEISQNYNATRGKYGV